MTAPPAVAHRPHPARKRNVDFLTWLKRHPNVTRTASILLFFAWWEYAGRDSNPLFMTYPTAIFKAAWQITVSGELPRAFIDSMIPFSIGLAISIVGGVVLGIFLGQFWFLEHAFGVFVDALYAIPRVALIPLIILWAGIDVLGKVTIIVSIGIFPVLVNTYTGIKDVRGNLIEIGRAYAATELQIFLNIVLPASVPYIMAGVRLALGISIIGMIVAEFFTAVTGLGGLMVLYANDFATAKLFVLVIVTGVLGIVLTELSGLIERRLSRWRISERSRF